MNETIDQMYAWVTTDPDTNTEGVLSWQIGDTHMPLVGADFDRADSLKPYASEIGRALGIEVRLLRFTVRETCETIAPKRSTRST